MIITKSTDPIACACGLMTHSLRVHRKRVKDEIIVTHTPFCAICQLGPQKITEKYTAPPCSVLKKPRVYTSEAEKREVISNYINYQGSGENPYKHKYLWTWARKLGIKIPKDEASRRLALISRGY